MTRERTHDILCSHGKYTDLAQKLTRHSYRSFHSSSFYVKDASTPLFLHFGAVLTNQQPYSGTLRSWKSIQKWFKWRTSAALRWQIYSEGIQMECSEISSLEDLQVIFKQFHPEKNIHQPSGQGPPTGRDNVVNGKPQTRPRRAALVDLGQCECIGTYGVYIYYIYIYIYICMMLGRFKI